ncbi:DUF3995 domain-containing protein [Nocardia sp. NPDC058499]|uniref:DUF3995 domain-containing protein n=1 Tax=Nocardia sp. NPDC058499 TaxID=3346530 RepID=UPI0036467893
MASRSGITAASRVVAAVGLGAVGVLHAVWAGGGHWPAAGERELAEAVTGSVEMPPAAASGIVAVAATGAGLVAGGVLGERPAAVWMRRAAGTALVARGLTGGVVAGQMLRLPPPGVRFRMLDTRYYRPLCLILGVAALTGARRPDSRAAR